MHEAFSFELQVCCNAVDVHGGLKVFLFPDNGVIVNNRKNTGDLIFLYDFLVPLFVNFPFNKATLKLGPQVIAIAALVIYGSAVNAKNGLDIRRGAMYYTHTKLKHQLHTYICPNKFRSSQRHFLKPELMI